MDDELYGDLEDTVAKQSDPSMKSQKITHTLSHTEATHSHLHSLSKSLTRNAPSTMTMATTPYLSQSEIIQLQQQIDSLKAENEILKKNMGILYRTSKSELDRKDRTIDRLQDELDALRWWKQQLSKCFYLLCLCWERWMSLFRHSWPVSNSVKNPLEANFHLKDLHELSAFFFCCDVDAFREIASWIMPIHQIKSWSTTIAFFIEYFMFNKKDRFKNII